MSRFGRYTYLHIDLRRATRITNAVALASRTSVRFNGTASALPLTPAGHPKKELGEILAEVIKTTGPMSIAAYMRQCLTNPDAGYYINKDPFGQGGDFITSPEISQMFGELIGVWVLTEWMALGKQPESRIIELGPGRGTLMSDMVKAFQSFPPFKQTIREICMVEASPTLRKMQHNLLCGETPLVDEGNRYSSITKYNLPIYWHENLKDIANDELTPYIIAHEFFDALPIHQFEHTQKGWRELLVDYSVPDKSKTSSIILPNQTITTSAEPAAPTFHLTIPDFATASSKVIPTSSTRYSKLPVLSKIEVSPESWDVALDISNRVQHLDEARKHITRVGAALIIDYGPADTVPVDTLRAIKSHKIVSPFEEPGKADLSADVDFGALKQVAEREGGIDVHGPVEQGDWLHALGIGARATMLANQQSTPEGKERIAKAYYRLTERSGGAMGKVYKVMALTPKGTPVPVGFGGGVDDDE
ncbi:S-adenosyl-L-methionine-dependent methyltransferase [Limtongia smithiae]|uniref:S-adenosyl-L-methionine-dependent methyltransferase n=1 Tax=Limtongia smithiae TaxID=1125753 RepID=UPI0034CFFD99